ncbi:MAG TPA: SGNH/GDSL hydrolase family protein [Solirubrobacteraceae bacterium]|nr:SGNH/GDSL hydrolase family protein [Solirubrobacteraceae bacterium]
MYCRYVALGDSTTEGMEDLRPDGTYRGWADRLAERLAVDNPDLLYANLAIRGRRMSQVREEQLPPALALRPDLATVVAGLNDLLRRRYDPDAMARDLEHMLSELRGVGATTLTFTIPDLSCVSPIARIVRTRLFAFNEMIREVARDTGTIVVDVGAEPVALDPRLWSVDRLHASPLGHERIASGFIQSLGLDNHLPSWREPLPPVEPPRRRPHALVASEVIWVQRYFTPWIIRRLRGRSSGDGRMPKRPELASVELPTL